MNVECLFAATAAPEGITFTAAVVGAARGVDQMFGILEAKRPFLRPRLVGENRQCTTPRGAMRFFFEVTRGE